MKTGWDLLEERRRFVGEIEAAAVQINDDIRIVDPAALRGWLERMTFFDPDHDRDWPGHASPGSQDFSFCLWTADQIWYVDKNEGFAQLRWHPRTPESWVKSR